MLDQHSIAFLERYINRSSPTGYEFLAQELWIDYIRPYVDEIFQDNYANTVGIVNPDAPFKVVLEAHADEISWQVNYIDEDGFIYVIENGDSDAHVAPGKPVRIHTQSGIVHGVFGWPAIHMRKDIDGLAVDAQHLFVDCGCSSRAEVEDLGISVGDAISYHAYFTILNNRYFMGRGLDNKIGGLIIAEVARYFRQKNYRPPFGLYFINAVQEEVGFNGATMIVARIKPDIAIVTDVSHDTSTPWIDKKRHGDARCGKGPIIAIAPAIHKGLLELIFETAQKEGIPYQKIAVAGDTETDAHEIALSNGGICTALISPPQRYMHTPVEMVHRGDVENVIRLICKTVERIDPRNPDLNSRIKFID